VFWTFSILWRQNVYLAEAIGIIALYIAYVAVVVIGRYIYQKHKKQKHKNLRRSASDIAFPAPKPGQELVEGRRKHPQNGLNIHRAVALISGSDSGVFARHEDLNQASTGNNSDQQVMDVSRDTEDLESHRTIGSQDLDTISVNSDITSSVSVSKASDCFLPRPESRGTSPLVSRQRSNSLPHFETPNEYDATLVRRLQQRRRQLGIKRMTIGIANALDIGETIGVAFLGHPEIIHPQMSTSVQDKVELDNDDENGESTPLLSRSITFKERETDSALVKALKGLRPLDCTEWKNKAIIWKVLDILKVPVLFLLQLTIPVVDYDVDNNGWNKWLNIWHVFASPVLMTLAAGGYDVYLHGVFPIWSLVWIISTIAALIVTLSSKPNIPPIYHPFFAYLGFAVSIMWIYVVANEIVNVLETVGVVFDIRSGILGLTFLAWGNSIGDFVSDVTMANQGFPRMGVSACFGGPLLNLLLGFGIGTTYKCFKSSGYTMHVSCMLMTQETDGRTDGQTDTDMQ
jgi:Ca2+/Na+ antiporter